MLYVLYGVLGYFIIGLITSLTIEFSVKWKNQRLEESNSRINEILDEGDEAIAQYAIDGIIKESPLDLEWNENEEVPQELIDHTRRQLLIKRNRQQPIQMTDSEIRFNTFLWPIFLYILFYVMVLHRPLENETYKEWVRRVENK